MTYEKLIESIKNKPCKIQSEKEKEEFLHKYKVLARKNQIFLQKLDNEIPFYPLSVSQYTTPKRQIEFLKVVWAYVRYGILKLKELKP